MMIFSRLSARFRASIESVNRVMKVPSRVGSRKNRPMDMPAPSSTARVVMTEVAFSLPRCFSSHCSSLESSYSAPLSPSSGKNSAEYIRAVTPLYMESAKFTMPRMKGRPNTG